MHTDTSCYWQYNVYNFAHNIVTLLHKIVQYYTILHLLLWLRHHSLYRKWGRQIIKYRSKVLLHQNINISYFSLSIILNMIKKF